MSRRMIPCLTLLAVAVLAPAEDLDLGDLRSYGDSALPFTQVRLGIGATTAPARYDTKFLPDTGAEVSYTDIVHTGPARTYSFGVVGGSLDPYGMVIGVELVHTSTRQSLLRRQSNGANFAPPSSLQDTHYRLLGPNLLLGGGWSINDRVHLEVLALAGIGFARAGHADGGMTLMETASGWYWNAGVRAGVYATIRRFVIGGSIELNSVHGQFRNHWANGDSKSTAEATELGARFEIGYKIQ